MHAHASLSSCLRLSFLQVMASQKQMEAKFRQAQATSDDWLKRAELAVSKGEDELAREALKRRKAYQVRSFSSYICSNSDCHS
jgi:phage shock protein A